MFETLLVPFLIYLIASSSIPDHLVNWFGRFMPGGRKFASLKAGNPPTLRSLQTCRNSGASLNSGVAPISSFLTIPPLYHFPHPSVPVYSAMGFETLFLSYQMCALSLQYVNIYKVNVHLIDFQLVLFIAVFLSRRLAWNILTQTLTSEVLYTAKYVLCLLLKGIGLFALVCMFSWLLWKLFQENGVQNSLFLCYPLVMYLIAFGFTLDPQGNRVLLKLNPHRELSPSSQNQMLDKKHTANKEKEKESEHVSNGVIKPESKAPKQCSVPPDAIRYEAECLRTDFNLRIKQVLFQSLLCAYYVGFIPMKFSEQYYIYYDMLWACQHIMFIWCSSFLMLMTFLLPLNYCDALHKCALHLGGWERYTQGHRDTPHVWSAVTVWPQGVLVRHNKGLFKALGTHNVAVPGDSHHSRFFFMFESPLRLVNWITSALLLLVLYQLFLITRSFYWHQLTSIIGLLLFNYIILYRVLRDRWTLQTVVNSREEGDSDS